MLYYLYIINLVLCLLLHNTNYVIFTFEEVIEMAKEKTVICLSGSANCGKTQTLNYVREQLLKKGKIVHEEKLRSQDFRCAINVDGKIVGISSRGDIVQFLEDDLPYLEKHKCEIYICTCRTKGKTRGYINDFATGKKLIVYKKDGLSGDCDLLDNKEARIEAMNRKAADEILEILEEILKK